MISIENLSFSYTSKGAPALLGITVTIPEGVHLLVGENGAGKTTLLHILAGLARPTSGECLVNGRKSFSDNVADKGEVFLLEENMPFPLKSIREFARVHSGFYPKFSQKHFLDNLLAFGLTGDEPFKSQSLGNRKKAQLAYALSLGVELLLLDEPTNALDIQSKETLRKLISSNLADNQTIIVSTHTISELENLFDGAVMLNRSRLLFAGTEDAVAEKLAFEVTRVADPDALYTENQIGRSLNIFPAVEGEPTRVDWRLLYSALNSPKRDSIINALNR